MRVEASSQKTESRREIFVFKSLSSDPKVCHKNPPTATCLRGMKPFVSNTMEELHCKFEGFFPFLVSEHEKDAKKIQGRSEKTLL